MAYWLEENRLLRRQLGGRRLRRTDDERRRLAARADRLGRQALREVATIVTADTLLPVAPPAHRPQMDLHQGRGRAGAASSSRSAAERCGWPRGPPWGVSKGRSRILGTVLDGQRSHGF